MKKLLIILLGIICISCSTKMPQAPKGDQSPQLSPKIADCTIPPNIAPLNFKINETGKKFIAQISGDNSVSVTISSKNGVIQIPPKKWKKILNGSNKVSIDIAVKPESDTLQQYKTVSLTVAQEEIDPFLVYRFMPSYYIRWKEIQIVQRDITSFKEKSLLDNKLMSEACMNCHSFNTNNPEQFLIHLRGGPGTSMLMVDHGNVKRVETQTDFNRAGAYPAWHPNGKLVAMSVNHVTQKFHAIGENREVYDTASDLILYDIENNMIKTYPLIASTDKMETYPYWSPDGQYLYFCSADPYDQDKTLLEQYEQVRYDLCRIKYDYDSNTWGEIETLIAADKIGKSLSQPRVSQDGKFCILCVTDHGSFPVVEPSSDLYLYNIETGEHGYLDCNSPESDSYHTWSSNSRWFIFSSKRRDGLYARPFICYIDENGKTGKPFVLPQKDPEYYDTLLKTYNVPELVKGPLNIRTQVLTKLAYDENHLVKAQLDPNVKVDGVTGATVDAPYSAPD